MKKEININISMIGDACVGKTTIAGVLLNKKFSNDYEPTIGGSLVSIPFTDNETKKCFYIWDTAGMEKYRSLAPVYYRDSLAAIIIFDISSRLSFDHLEDWITHYRDNTKKNMPILIIGNKIDLEAKVDTKEASDFASSHKCEFLEVSAKTGKNIDKIIPMINDLIKSEKIDDEIPYCPPIDTKKEESSCC